MNENDIKNDLLKQHLQQHLAPESYMQGKSLVAGALDAYDQQLNGFINSELRAFKQVTLPALSAAAIMIVANLYTSQSFSLQDALLGLSFNQLPLLALGI